MPKGFELLLPPLTSIAESLQAIAESMRSTSIRNNPQQKCDALLERYIAKHQGQFTRFVTKQRIWTEKVSGACAGRYTKAVDGSWTLSVPAARFATYMRERGVDKQHLKRWFSQRDVKTTTGKIVRLGSPMRVYLIPVKL